MITKNKKHLRDLLLISLGNFIMSFAYAKLMIPHKVLNGGVTSLSMIITKFVPIRIDLINSYVLISLLILTTIFLGKELLIKSIVSSVVYTIFFSYFINLSFTIDWPSIPALFVASLLISFGYFCCLTSNSSTVGVDILALIIIKYRPKIPIAKLIGILNFIILGIGLLVYGLWSVLLGLLFSFIYSYELNTMLTHYSKNVS